MRVHFSDSRGVHKRSAGSVAGGMRRKMNGLAIWLGGWAASVLAFCYIKKLFSYIDNFPRYL